MTPIHSMITYANTLPADNIYRRIIEVFLSHLEDACTLSIEQMAERCFTSPTTLTRLSRVIGYKGYADFRTQLDQAVHNYRFYNQVLPFTPQHTQEIEPAYKQCLWDQILQFEKTYDADYYESICDAMHDSDAVVLFTGRLQGSAMTTLQADLAMTGVRCLRAMTIDDQFQVLESLTDRSFVILRPGSLNTDRNVLSRLISGIRAKKAKLLVIGAQGNHITSASADFLCDLPRTGTVLDTHIQDMVYTLLSAIYRFKFIRI